MSEDSDYMDCFKYLPFDEGSLCVLTEGTIKFTNPLSFNDPFECLPVYNRDPSKIRRDNRAFLDTMIDRAAAGRRISASVRSQRRQKLAHQLAIHPGTNSWQQNVFGDMGICCLSRNPFSILMWSHYAGFHSGLVVGFRLKRLTENYEDPTRIGRELLPLSVSYADKRPVIDWGAGTERMIEQMILNKARHWAYEQEERVIDWSRGADVHPYERNKILSCVIAGAKMGVPERTKLDQIVAELKNEPGLASLRLFQARLSETEYAIDIPGLPEPKRALKGE